MKILMTNHRLRERGGSELFVAEVAASLRLAGQEVCVFSTVGGMVAEMLEKAGLPVVNDPAQCPWRPDIIHGQHHLETMAALAAWPDVRAIYFLHGATPWEEQPPSHPRIVKYLGTTPRFVGWIARQCGVEEATVGVVRNFFSPTRFREARDPGRKTGRALIYHNTMDPKGRAFAELFRACEKVGLRLDGIGTGFGRVVPDPENALPKYDVVFAGGRSAIEALACGCSVIPVTKERIGTLVQPENYSESVDRNFCADDEDPPISEEAVVTQLHRVDSARTAQVSAQLRMEATTDKATARLLECYAEAMKAKLATSDENAALGRYLLSLAAYVKDTDQRRAELLDRLDQTTDRAERWKLRAEESSAKLDWMEQKLSAGPWWHRRLWRKLRRTWEASR